MVESCCCLFVACCDFVYEWLVMLMRSVIDLCVVFSLSIVCSWLFALFVSVHVLFFFGGCICWCC